MLVMQLRKCCNHPYLFPGAEPGFDGVSTGAPFGLLQPYPNCNPTLNHNPTLDLMLVLTLTPPVSALLHNWSPPDM